MLIFPEEVIVEYIKTYITEDFNFSPDGQWININSIFTHDDKYRMGFNIPGNYVHDFKIEESWPLKNFVKMHQETNGVEADKLLMRIFMKHLKGGINFSRPKKKIVPAIDLTELKCKPEMKELANKNVLRNKIGRKAIRYLIHRGFGVKHILKYGLKYCDQWDCYECNGTGLDEEEGDCNICNGSGRNPYYGWLIIPSFENKKFVYYIGRNLDKESTFRYRNPKNLAKSQVVFFYDQLKENNRIFITEGVTDAMTLYDYNVACIMGNRISDPQIQKILKKNPTEIIFIPDYDETSEKRKIIARALKKNLNGVRRFNETVKVGVYRWYKKYKNKGKDLNDINHTVIEEDLIWYKNFKDEIKDKLNNV